MHVATSGHQQHITGVILAGGQGTRMGGRDKGLLAFGETTLVGNTLAQLRPQVADLLIVANRNIHEYRQYGCAVVPDKPPAHRGPLGGLASAMDHVTTTWLLAVPCDIPALPADLAARLWRGATNRGATIARACNEADTHPLLTLIHASLQADLEDSLQTGIRAVHKWQARHDPLAVDFSDCPQAFVNLNTPEQMTNEASTTLGHNQPLNRQTNQERQ